MSEFWLGIILSFPIGIATALITPWFQRKVDQIDRRRSLAISKRVTKEYELVVHFHKEPIAFTQYLVQVAIRTTFISALMGVFSGLMFSFGQALFIVHLPMAFYELRNTPYLIGQFITLAGSLLIMNTCRPALSIWTKVNNFDEYSQSMESAFSVSRPEGRA